MKDDSFPLSKHPKIIEAKLDLALKALREIAQEGADSENAPSDNEGDGGYYSGLASAGRVAQTALDEIERA